MHRIGDLNMKLTEEEKLTKEQKKAIKEINMDPLDVKKNKFDKLPLNGILMTIAVLVILFAFYNSFNYGWQEGFNEGYKSAIDSAHQFVAVNCKDLMIHKV